MSIRWTLFAVGLLMLPADLFAQPPEDGTAKFDHAEYMQPATAGKKKAGPAVKGMLVFDAQEKSVQFLDKKGSPAFDVKYDAIKSMLYERASRPRYVSAVLISPLFLLAHGKKHFLTIQYTDGAGTRHYVIVHLDKKNAREAIATAEAQTGKNVERAEDN